MLDNEWLRQKSYCHWNMYGRWSIGRISSTQFGLGKLSEIVERILRIKTTNISTVKILDKNFVSLLIFFFLDISCRFYFISTDELLSMLGSSEPSCVQEHMIKVSVMEV